MTHPWEVRERIHPWKVVGVAACLNPDHDACNHALATGSDPFLYTFGLADLVHYELWISARGTCGHSLHIDGACRVLNTLGRQLADATLGPDRVLAVTFDSGDVLVFSAGEPLAGRGELLKTYMAGDAEVAVVTWSCCGHPDQPRCTGLTATWCPVHGQCTCRPQHGMPGPGNDDGCPLHEPT